MKLYADTSARFAGQLLAHLLFLSWVIAWIWMHHPNRFQSVPTVTR